MIVSVMDRLDLAGIVMVTAPLTSLLDLGMSCGLHCWIFVGLLFSSVISLLSKLSSYWMHTNKMEKAPNKRNALAGLMDDVFVKIISPLYNRTVQFIRAQVQ